MIKFFNILTTFFTKGHERSIKAKKNIIASFIIKGLNIIIGLALVPLTINYLNPTKYGIWITLSSIIGWFGFFDIGLGHGLRNRFAEALAKGEHELAKIYVSTTYAILSIVIGFVLILIYTVNPFLNWGVILNAGTDTNTARELSIVALIVFTFFCFRFVLKLITNILQADQKPAFASVFDLVAKFISLIIIFLMVRFTHESLINLALVMSLAPVIVLGTSTLFFFSNKYKAFRPSFKSIDFSRASDLLKLGLKFFIIQIAAVLLFQTNNIIISHLFGPEDVTPYNVAYKYFNIMLMVFSIIITPFWSAFTEAWVKREFIWIRKTMHRLFRIWGILFFGLIILVFVSPFVFRIWVGEKVNIPMTLSIVVAVWVAINAWNGIFSHFLNGVGKLKLQFSIGIISAIVNIPLAIFFGKKIGVEGVLFANIILGLNTAWIFPVQYQKIIRGKAKGIWNE